jgi:AhpD family alkylhydroperoxidase
VGRCALRARTDRVEENRAESDTTSPDATKVARRTDNLLGRLWAHFEEEEEVRISQFDEGMSKMQFERELGKQGSAHCFASRDTASNAFGVRLSWCLIDGSSRATWASDARAGKEPSMSEHEEVYPHATREIAEQRNRLAPGPAEAFRAFSQSVFAEGAVPAKTKQLIAVAVAHVTQCPYCIRSHTRAAMRHGVAPGSHLGRRGDARGRRLRALGRGTGYDRPLPGRGGRATVKTVDVPESIDQGKAAGSRAWAPASLPTVWDESDAGS